MIPAGTQRAKSVIASLNGSLFQARVCNFCREHIIWCELIYLGGQSFDYNQGHPTTVSIRVLLDLEKCILSGAIKFVPVRSS